MNEYIKNDKRELIFDFCFFGKIGVLNGNARNNATHLISSLFVNCKIVILVRVYLLN